MPQLASVVREREKTTLDMLPGENAGHGVDIDGGVGQAGQQELLVDDSLNH